MEYLKTDAIFSEASDAIRHNIGNFTADSVVSASVIIGSIFFAGDELVRVEQLTVRSSANSICKKTITNFNDFSKLFNRVHNFSLRFYVEIIVETLVLVKHKEMRTNWECFPHPAKVIEL